MSLFRHFGLLVGLLMPWCEGSKLLSNFHPTSRLSRTTALTATVRFSTDALVCGNHGRKIIVSESEGVFPEFPPGSRVASIARITETRTRLGSSQASVSSAHSSPHR